MSAPVQGSTAPRAVSKFGSGPAIEVSSTASPAASGTPVDLDAVTLAVRESAPTSAVTPFRPEAPKPLFTDDDSDIDWSDLRLPAINIAQGVGALGETYPPGSIILGQEHVLLLPNDQKKEPQKSCVVFGVLAFRKTRWAEKTGGERGRIVNTREEVAALGGTIDYEENARDKTIPYFQELATALLLVQCPADADDDLKAVFPFEGPDGKKYVLATWNMKGISYTNGAKALKTSRKIGYPVKSLKGRFIGGLVELRTLLQNYGKNSAFRPQLAAGEPTTPAFRIFAHEAAGLEPDSRDLASVSATPATSASGSAPAAANTVAA